MKIQMIVHWTGDWTLIDKEVTPYNTTVAISEMIDDTHLLLLDEPDDFDALETAMEAQSDVLVVGSYLMSGEQYLWGNAVSRNHTIFKYKDELKDVIEYDENNEPIGSRRPTEAEALETQVNKIYGHADRILN